MNVALLVLTALVAQGDANADVDAGVPVPITPREVVDDAGVADVVDDADAGVAVAAAAVVEGFALQARVEPQPVVFGQELTLVVELTRPPRTRVLVPEDLGASEELPRTSAPPIRRSVEVDGAVKETLLFGFLALDIKDATTPAFTITIGESGDTVDVPALPVRIVTEPLPDLTDGGVEDGAMAFEGPASTLSYRVDDPRPWALLALLAITTIVAVLLRLALKARQLSVPEVRAPPPPPPRPAHEVALERLDALMPLLARDDVTTFVEKLMDEVLRDYLAGRFMLSAGTRTTKEIVTDLLSVASVGLDVDLIERLGMDADMVKFARANLAREQAHAMAGRVRALILATKSAPPNTPEAASS
jgi:hypothetical protein